MNEAQFTDGTQMAKQITLWVERVPICDDYEHAGEGGTTAVPAAITL